MNINIKTLIALAAVTLISIVAYNQISSFFEKRHQIELQRDTIKKSVGENTEAAAQILKIEVTPNSITFGELFEQGDDRVKKLSEAIIPVGISSLPVEERDAIKSYMEELQEVLRLQVAKNRKILAVSTSLDLAKSAQRDYANETNEYSERFARTRAENALDEAKKNLEESTKATQDFRTKLISFRGMLNVVRSKLSDYDLLDDKLLKSVIQKQTG